jgi:hypothetical protein
MPEKFLPCAVRFSPRWRGATSIPTPNYQKGHRRREPRLKRIPDPIREVLSYWPRHEKAQFQTAPGQTDPECHRVLPRPLQIAKPGSLAAIHCSIASASDLEQNASLCDEAVTQTCVPGMNDDVSPNDSPSPSPGNCERCGQSPRAYPGL